MDIPREEFIKLNNRLSRQYKEEPNHIKRQAIIKNLYQLNIPLFKSWRVFNREDREDFEQETFFWIERALETFNFRMGAFVNWLKTYYVRKANAEQQKKAKEEGKLQALAGTEEAKNQELDSLFWKKVEELCDEEEWKILTGVFFEKKTHDMLSDEIGKSATYIGKKKSSVFQRIKDMRIKESLKENQNGEFFKKDLWITTLEFSEKMSYTLQYVKKLVSPKPVANYYIDRRDIARTPRVRIHYVTDSEGKLVCPRYCRKVKTGKICLAPTEQDKR
jgi:hypothetical protein